jgi:hypothetical protein
MKFEEQIIQKACVRWFRAQHPNRILYANYNNAHNRTQGGINKGMGVTAGVPDLTYIHPTYGLLYIEVKTKKGRVSDAQKEFLSKLDGQYPCFLVRSFDDFLELCEAIDTIHVDSEETKKFKYIIKKQS